MATNVCTILLDAYVPEHHLVAVDGCLQSQANFQNLSTVRRRVYALPLHEGWGALLSARGRSGYAVTLYGDTFERRYFEGMLRFHRAANDGTFGELTAKPLPNAVDLPLEQRFAELDQAAGQAPYLQRTVYVALFGEYATRERREWLERALGEAADEGWRAALKHGLGVEFVLAETIEALAAYAAEGALSAVVATPEGWPSVIQARSVSVADGTRGALIAPGVTQGGPEMVNDAIGADWFLWGLPDEQDVPGALAAFLRHACAKTHFRTLLESANLPCVTPDDQARLARLGGCRPTLLLEPPAKVERDAECYRPLRWSVPWAETFPEITGGTAPTFAVHPGEDSIAVRVEGDRAIWRGLAIYGTAEVSCVWNGGLDQRRFEVSCVSSSQASTESRVRVAKKWLDAKWVTVLEEEGRITDVVLFAGTSVCLDPIWLNPHGERLSSEGMRWEVEARTPDAHHALPKVTDAAGQLTIEVPEADVYDVTLTHGGQQLCFVLRVYPQPIGVDVSLASEDRQTRISGEGDAWRVRLCPRRNLRIVPRYRYAMDRHKGLAKVLKRFPYLSFSTDPDGLPKVFGSADFPGKLVEKVPGEWVFAVTQESTRQLIVFGVSDFAGARLGVTTHTPCKDTLITVKVVADWTARLTMVSVVATVVCALCFHLADYGLDNARTAVYLVAGGAQGILFLTRLFVNRARVVQLLGALVILGLFLYELWQEML